MDPILILYFLWGGVTGWGATEIMHGIFDKHDCKCEQVQCVEEEVCCTGAEVEK
jgi:hypothetical protein